MPNFFKSLFSSSEDKRKDVKIQKDVNRSEDHKEFSTPYDTKRKLSISRSGKMKQNLKARGKLGNDLFGEIPQKVEKVKIEYHVNKKLFEEVEKMDINEAESELKNDSAKIKNESMDQEVKDSVNSCTSIIEDDDVNSELAKFEEEIEFITNKYTETNF